MMPDPRESPAAQQRRVETNSGAILVVPMYYQNKTFGAIMAINRATDPDFTPPDMGLMVAVASQVAVVIENVRLFEQAQQELGEL